MNPNIKYMAPFLIAAIMMAWIAAKAWPRRQVRGGRFFILFCLSAGYWSLTEGLLYLGLTVEANLLITCFQYVGIVTAAPTFFILSCTLFGFESWIRPPRAALLYIIPALALISVWTNPWHHLHYTDWYAIDSGQFVMLGLVHGPFFWIMAGYDYLMMILTFLILAHQVITSSGFNRGQAGVILSQLPLVWGFNIIYLTGHSPIPNMDISPIAFAFMALSFAWGFFRYNLLDIVPIAKAEVFDGISDSILVLDKQNRLVALNPAAQKLIDKASDEILGRNVEEVLEPWPEQTVADSDKRTAELSLTRNGHSRIYEIRFSLLKDWKGRAIGKLAVLHDISERKKLEEELINLATTDSLTGAFNRRRLLELAETEFSRIKRYGQDLSVIMIDLDYFKRVNDNYGHDMGDEVLKALSRSCLDELREVDCFGRLGGEEFAVILTQTTLSHAKFVAERLRARIESLTLATRKKEPLKVTISLGVASSTPSDKTFKDILKRADRALYQAKAEGRNRVVAKAEPG